jgi:addiction module HigA family antidote
MTTDTQRVYPDLAIPPGETLAETLEALGMSQAELARRAKRPVQAISEIVQGKKEITAETALELERVVGVPQHVWMRLETDYRSVKARSAEADRLRKEVPLAKRFPYAAMATLKWVPDVRDWVDRVRELLNFFGVASLVQVKLAEAAWRKSAALRLSLYALAAWLRKGELDAQKVTTKEFDEAGLIDTLPVLRGLTREPDFADRLRSLLADRGVAVAFVPHLPQTGAHGATRWVAQKATMQLSIRYAYADVFWFTVFHELGHLLLHGRRHSFIEVRGNENDEREREANRFAEDHLIPRSLFEAFLRTNLRISRAAIVRFAEQVGVSTGVVVGRLQSSNHLSHAQLNDLRPRLVWKARERRD